LGDLPSGKYRHLTAQEVAYLQGKNAPLKKEGENT
jgi:hypothetical protein